MSGIFLKTLMGMAICMLLFTGCGTTHHLLKREPYEKELIPNDRIYFRQVWTKSENGELTVSGRLRLKGMIRIDIPDHVEVALVDRSGTVIAVQKTTFYPRVLTGRKHHSESKFSVRFSEIPPAGTTIRLRNVNG